MLEESLQAAPLTDPVGWRMSARWLPLAYVLVPSTREHVGERKPSSRHPPSDRVGERRGLQRFLEHAAGAIVIPLCCGEERAEADEGAEHQRRREPETARSVSANRPAASSTRPALASTIVRMDPRITALT